MRAASFAKGIKGSKVQSMVNKERTSDYRILNLTENPELAEKAALWFSQKWRIPLEAYCESIGESLAEEKSVPQWYVILSGERIAGGCGVIENDFHLRKNLTPNLCALYIEEPDRCRGLAGELLSFVCEDMKERNIEVLYLITDHTSFYERYGWQFLCMVQEEGTDGPDGMARMYRHIL